MLLDFQVLVWEICQAGDQEGQECYQEYISSACCYCSSQEFFSFCSASQFQSWSWSLRFLTCRALSLWSHVHDKPK